MIRYGRSDIEEVRVPSTGHLHTRAEGAERIAIECAACDEHLARMGMVTDVTKVELTYAEQMEKAETERRELTAVQALAQAVANGAR